MAVNQKIAESSTVTDHSGNNRLVLRFVTEDDHSYDFYSLDWEIKVGTEWTRKTSISKADFEKGSEWTRWISDVQSFDPSTGRARLRVGEQFLYVPGVSYSRRDWDLLGNQQVRIIQVCQSPFEPFDEGRAMAEANQGELLLVDRKIVAAETLTNEAGDNRLVIRDVEGDVSERSELGEVGRYFYSLDWEIKDRETWVQRLAISHADLQKGCEGRRWIHKLQSFDPSTGRAIFKIGAEELDEADGVVRVIYTWREWDVLTNREVRVIQVCTAPSEPFNEGNNGK